MKRYRYNINNLDCANCARAIEDSLNKNKDFSNAVVNFSSSKLTYESDKEFSEQELNRLIHKIEPDANVSKEEIEVKKEFNFYILLLALLIGLLGYFLPISKSIKIILYIISYAMLLYRTFINSVNLLIKSVTINENALITISCLGALMLGEVIEGMMVITLYTLGKILEEKAVNKSRKSIKDLLDIKQPFANKKTGKIIKRIDVEDIKVGDILIVKKGEKIPVDGIVVKGSTLLDTSSLTGEADLVEKSLNDEVLSGCINEEDVIEIKATSMFSNSTVAKILELLESATDKKSKTETVISKISRIYTPIVILLALFIIIFFPILFNITLDDSIYRGLTFLVISCPCAIAISIPLSYFTGIGVAGRHGILIKGSNYLDNLSNTKNIIFDKTGTLTDGSFTVTKVEVNDKNYTKEEIIDILVKGESLSNHPIAKSILKLSNKEIDNSDIKDFKEKDGKGIFFKLDNKEISIGNNQSCNCDIDALIHLNINGSHVASITINDGIKENAKKTIEELKALNIKTYMFTGDKKEIALAIGKKIGIEKIKYEMLPTEKYEEFEKVANDEEITVFVGDGVNDAPVLKRSDIGISMGGVGTDSAINASDVVLMNDDLSKIVSAINISKYTKYIIKQNLIFAIVVKLLILLLSALGYANMWLAVFADTGVTLLTILNTLRIMKK